MKKIRISKEKLDYLYCVKKLPFSRIAKIFSCSSTTIFKNMKLYNLPSRTMSESKTIYTKKDFSGNLMEKAYMIGFRLGDLNVYRKGKLICVQSNTTKICQARLIKSLFQKYGHIPVQRYGPIFKLQTGLNQSFSFLLSKKDKIEKWILDCDELFLSFFAGYVDAEGNIGVYQRPRIRVRTYDKNILFSIHKKLKCLGIRSKYGIESFRGTRNMNNDFYHVSINRGEDICNLINILGPYLRHWKRKNDLNKVNKFLVG